MTEPSYHPGNLKLVPYPDAAVIELADHARRLGILIHIASLPFGDWSQSARIDKLAPVENSVDR